MKGIEAEKLLESIGEAFGLTKHDFIDGRPFYTVWGEDEKTRIDLANLGDRSLKISKNLGDIYIDKISTDHWVVVGRGTTLHYDDLHAGKGFVDNFEGFLM